MRVAVIGGAGHVGLPLSLVLAERGCVIRIVDIDSAKLDSIRAGNFPFKEDGGGELLSKVLSKFPENLEFFTDYAAVRECDIVIVTIGTPVDEHLNPNFSVIESCMKRLQPFLCDGQTLVLRSTLFPGTSERVLSLLRKAGSSVGVAFCPERIAQGFALTELTELPQIISGSDPRALDHAKALFSRLDVDLIELQLHEAEVAKLFLNSWRYVAFATANQFYQIALSKGIDFDRIRAAITHKYKRAGAFPMAGFSAGPCLFKDTMQLAAYCRHKFSLGHAAMLVNETMPDCVVDEAKKVLAKTNRTIAGMKCGILGMAFKPNNDDSRESLAFKLRRLLIWENAEVFCSDVYIQQEGFVDAETLIATCDVIIVGCPHREYAGLAYRDDQVVVDCFGSTRSPSLVVSSDGDAVVYAPAISRTPPQRPNLCPPPSAPSGRRVLVTGSQGFLMSFVVPELLRQGHAVLGVDNVSKVQEKAVVSSEDCHPSFRLERIDAGDVASLKRLAVSWQAEVVVASAAPPRTTGPFSWLSKTQHLISAAVEVCVELQKAGHLRRLLVVDASSKLHSQSSDGCATNGNGVTKRPAELSKPCFLMASAAASEYGLPVRVIGDDDGTTVGGDIAATCHTNGCTNGAAVSIEAALEDMILERVSFARSQLK